MQSIIIIQVEYFFLSDPTLFKHEIISERMFVVSELWERGNWGLVSTIVIIT